MTMDRYPSDDRFDSATETPTGRTVSRRAVLAALGAGAALTLAPLDFASAAPRTDATGRTPSGTESKTITGHLDQGVADFVYLPVQVPAGVNQIAVEYSYSKPSVPAGTPANSCDIGIFDAHGIDPGGRGYRGWSGGFRTSYSISRTEATPGYLPGDVMPGTWHVVLGPYQVAPQGLDYTVTVTLTYGAPGAPFVPHYPPTKATGRGRAWYRGDCHLHTVYSDGKNTPDQVAAGARARKLDFMVSTDHNTSSSHAVWGPLAGPDLLIILGEEVTTRNGHWLAVGVDPGEFVDWRYRSRDDVFDEYQQQVHRAKGLVISAHLNCPWIGCEWKFGFDGLDATEVWTGPWGWDDDAALSTWTSLLAEAADGMRPWLPAVGDSDAHNPTDVIGLPMNVVLAEDLTRDAILAGLKAGHNWIAESADVDLSFVATAANGQSADIGDRLPVGATEKVTVTATVSGVPNGTVRILTDEGQMLQSSLPASGSGTVTWVTSPQGAAFVRAEVRHPLADGTPGGTTMGPTLGFGAMAALTNPIWLGNK